MRSFVAPLLLVVSCVSPGPVTGVTAAAAQSKEAKQVTNDTAAKAAALRLAEVLYSEESQLIAGDRLVDSMDSSFRANAAMAELEQEYPGIIQATVTAIRPLMRRYVISVLPEYRERVAILFASRFSATEIDDLARFYQSPTGKKAIAGMAENASASNMMKEVLADPDKPTSFDAISQDQRAAAAATRKRFDASDEPALLEFAAKPYFLRLAQLRPELLRVEQEFANDPPKEMEAEIEALVEGTMTQFIAQADSTRSRK